MSISDYDGWERVCDVRLQLQDEGVLHSFQCRVFRDVDGAYMACMVTEPDVQGLGETEMEAVADYIVQLKDGGLLWE